MNQLEISFGTPLRIVVAKEEAPLIYSRLTITDGSTRVTAKGDVMYTMPIQYGVGLQVTYVDAGGNPAAVDGPVAWSTSDASIVSIQVDTTDTTKCSIASGQNVGQAQISATADADLGAGVRNLVTLLDVTIVAGEAVAGTIAPVGAAAPITP